MCVVQISGYYGGSTLLAGACLYTGTSHENTTSNSSIEPKYLSSSFIARKKVTILRFFPHVDDQVSTFEIHIFLIDQEFNSNLKTLDHMIKGLNLG